MLGHVPTLRDSADVVQRQNRLLARDGYCFWAMEHRGAFAGWCGLTPGKGPIAGQLEVGWSLRPDLWGRGLATEAARASLAFAWARTTVPAVVAVTSVGNRRSRGVMERLRMERHAGGDFDHPDLAAGDPLRPHVTYLARRPARG